MTVNVIFKIRCVNIKFTCPECLIRAQHCGDKYSVDFNYDGVLETDNMSIEILKCKALTLQISKGVLDRPKEASYTGFIFIHMCVLFVVIII